MRGALPLDLVRYGEYLVQPPEPTGERVGHPSRYRRTSGHGGRTPETTDGRHGPGCRYNPLFRNIESDPRKRSNQKLAIRRHTPPIRQILPPHAGGGGGRKQSPWSIWLYLVDLSAKPQGIALCSIPSAWQLPFFTHKAKRLYCLSRSAVYDSSGGRAAAVNRGFDDEAVG